MVNKMSRIKLMRNAEMGIAAQERITEVHMACDIANTDYKKHLMAINKLVKSHMIGLSINGKVVA